MRILPFSVQPCAEQYPIITIKRRQLHAPAHINIDRIQDGGQDGGKDDGSDFLIITIKESIIIIQISVSSGPMFDIFYLNASFVPHDLCIDTKWQEPLKIMSAID